MNDMFSYNASRWVDGLFLKTYSMILSKGLEISPAFNLPLSEWSLGCYGCKALNIKQVKINGQSFSSYISNTQPSTFVLEIEGESGFLTKY